MAPKCENKAKLPSIRKHDTKDDPGRPWHVGKCPEFDMDAMTASLELYIDRVTFDEDIFNLGETYSSANQQDPLDPKGLADLSLFINAILDVAPCARVKKADMKICVLNAIHRCCTRKIQTDCSYEEAAGRVAKQVLRWCLILFVKRLHTCMTGLLEYCTMCRRKCECQFLRNNIDITEVLASPP